MSITLPDLISALRTQSPMGVDVPRLHETNAVDEVFIGRWAADAAGAINGARGITTIKEVAITILDGVQDYALPAESREVLSIERGFNAPNSSNTNLDIPYSQPVFGFGLFGNLPSGQEITASLDLIARQRLVRNRREDDWEIFSGMIRFVFPAVAGDIVRVTYRAIDRSYAAIPDDYFTHMLTYLRWQNLEWYMDRNGVAIVQDSDRLASDRLAAYARQARTLEDRWQSFINGISVEVS